MKSIFTAFSILSQCLYTLAWFSNTPQPPPSPSEAQTMPERLDFRLSFKKPFYYYNDNKTVPNFRTLGNVILNAESIRLTPSVPNMRGAIWSTIPNKYEEWSAVFSFQVEGRGYIGGEGLAFWYVKDLPTESGPFLGHKNVWDGFALLFDTSDEAARRYTPLVYGILNDGQKSVRLHDPSNNQLFAGSCFRDFRDTYGTPVYVKVTHSQNKIKVAVDLRQRGKAYSDCFVLENVKLPQGNYFGLSASTGPVFADDHDVRSLEVFQVNPLPRMDKSRDQFKMNEEIKQRIEQAEKFGEAVNADETVAAGESLQAITPKTIQAFQESQLKIIESLDLLHQTLGSKSVSGASTGGGASNPLESISNLNGKLDSISQRLQQVSSDIQRQTDSISSLQDAVRKLENGANGNLGRISQRIESINQNHARMSSQLNAAVEKTSGTSTWVYLSVFLLAQAAIVLGWQMIKLKRERKAKKFI